MEPIPLGVLGLGRMGRHHVRCAGLSTQVDLVAAGDRDPARSEGLPADLPFSTDPDELIARCDAIILAVPTDRHAELGAHILRAGRHLLVEKPLAPTAAECEELGRIAEAAGVVLRVGHVERLNGAVLAVRDRLDSPRFVEGHRLAAFDPRGTEVDVVLDLMIHDLDLILHLFGVEPTRVEAVGVAVFTDRVDIANARLEFPGGELVNLTASRASREPVRKLRLFQEDAYLSLDLNGQRAEIFARDAANAIGIAHETRLAPEGHNPLVAEIDGFASAIRGQASPVATAEEGRRAVALATRIRQSIDARRNVWAAGVGGVGWHDAPS